MLKFWNENVLRKHSTAPPRYNDNAWINMYRKEITFVLSFAIEYQSWYRVIRYNNDFCMRTRKRAKAKPKALFSFISIRAHIKRFTSNRFCIWLQCYTFFLFGLFLLFAIDRLCLLSNKNHCASLTVSISIYIISLLLPLITNIQSAISSEFNHIS